MTRFIKGCSRLYFPDYVDREMKAMEVTREIQQDRISSIARRSMPAALFVAGDVLTDQGAGKAPKYSPPSSATSGGVSGTVLMASTPFPNYNLPFVQPLDGATPWQGLKGRGGGPDHPIYGGLAGTGASTVTVGGVASSGDDDDGTCILFTTAAIIDRSYTMQTTGYTAGFMQRRHVLMGGQFKLSELTDNRFFFGACVGNIGSLPGANSDTPNVSSICIKYAAGVGGNLTLWTSDGVGGGADVNLIAATTNVFWCLVGGDKDGVYGRAWTSAADSGWKSATGTMPPTTTSLGNTYGSAIQTTANASKAYRMYWHGLRQR